MAASTDTTGPQCDFCEWSVHGRSRLFPRACDRRSRLHRAPGGEDAARIGADVTVADKQPFPDGVVDGGVRTVLGDLRDPAVAARAVDAGTDAVVHLAALTSVLRSVEDPAGTYEVNVAVTANLLELARERAVGTFIFASTNAVAGDVGRHVITERTPLCPLTPYGATKAAAEMLLSSYAAAYGIDGCALRFSNVYGPGMARKDSLVPRLMRAARSGAGIDVYGDGAQLRDLVHVDDIVAGMLTAWRAGYAGPLILASGTSDSVNDIVDAARLATGQAHSRPARPAQTRRDARGPRRHLSGAGARLRTRLQSRIRPGHGVAGVRGRNGRGPQRTWQPSRSGGSDVTSPAPGSDTARTAGPDRSVDDAAAHAFATEHADRARQLPPVAIVIAAYNEEGALGPVLDALPASICGLETATIVVVDGSVDGTAKEAHQHGALVCDVPVNRGQGAALRLGYRLAREGGASYIVTTDADGQYDPADAQRLLDPCSLATRIS